MLPHQLARSVAVPRSGWVQCDVADAPRRLRVGKLMGGAKSHAVGCRAGSNTNALILDPTSAFVLYDNSFVLASLTSVIDSPQPLRIH